MSRSVALLRGINVGTSKRILMPALRAMFERLGATEVETYLQSGNVVFAGQLEPAAIEAAIAEEFEVAPRVLVLTASQLRRVAAQNPLVEVADDPSRLFVYFVDAVPASTESPSDIAPEVVAIGEHAVYQWSPAGMGKTNVPPRFVKSLGPAATARNWRTVQALLEMIDA